MLRTAIALAIWIAPAIVFADAVRAPVRDCPAGTRLDGGHCQLCVPDECASARDCSAGSLCEERRFCLHAGARSCPSREDRGGGIFGDPPPYRYVDGACGRSCRGQCTALRVCVAPPPRPRPAPRKAMLFPLASFSCALAVAIVRRS